MDENRNQLEIIKEKQERFFRELLYADQRQHHLSDRLSSVEIQIAGLIFGLTFALSSPIDLIKETTTTRVILTVSLGFLILSILVGVFVIAEKEGFWKSIARKNQLALKKYGESRRDITKFSLENTDAYVNGLFESKEEISSSSLRWWLQSVFLGIGIMGIFYSFVQIIL